MDGTAIDDAMVNTGYEGDMLEEFVILSIYATDAEKVVARHSGMLMSVSIETRASNDPENPLVYPLRVWFNGRPEPVQTYAHLCQFISADAEQATFA